jgi:ethanolaminephosphotransferase
VQRGSETMRNRRDSVTSVWESTADFRWECQLLGENIDTLEPSSLIHLSSYKYQSVDKSHLSKYVLNPFWTYCAKFMPPWLAPNVITLLGIAAIYFNILCVEIYMPDLVSQAPSWVYFSFGIGLLFYQTMDNIDGKQARKTGTSSPLGELFDHGIDSLNCCLAGLVEAAAMGLGISGAGAFTTFSTCIAMYFSTWETYHTHVLYLGVLNGPTEGIVIAAAVMFLTGIYGPSLWLKSLADIIPGAPDFVLKDIWVYSVAFSVFFCHIPFCIYNVYEAKKSRKEDFLVTAWEVIPILVSSLSVYIWMTSPYSIVLVDNHLVLFALGSSFVFGRMTTAIIIAHLTKQKFPYWSLPMVPLICGALLVGFGFLSPATELLYLWLYFFFSVIYFLRYAQLVILTFCRYLNINCFTIKHADIIKAH